MPYIPSSPPQMHAPDGIFAAWLALIGWAITLGVIAIAVRQTRDQLGERQVPLMGVIAAAIFAGQMLNFTIPGGTSGHLLGGALAAILLGPWAAVLIMTAVIAVQALLFQDGGLLVMGLNIINMGIVTSMVGYFTHRRLSALSKNSTMYLAAAFIAGWLSVIVTSVFASVELALSGTSPLNLALPAMVAVHAMIGVGEGLLTVFALRFIMAARPDLISGKTAPGQRSASWVVGGLITALALTLAAPFASPHLDGLEKVADTQGFLSQGQDALFNMLPNYTIPMLGNGAASNILAGMIGVMLVFGVVMGIARLTKNKDSEPSMTAQ
jgi:cobalt/nickel transport system permease protein